MRLFQLPGFILHILFHLPDGLMVFGLRTDTVAAHLALHIVELDLFIGSLFDLFGFGSDLFFQFVEIPAALLGRFPDFFLQLAFCFLIVFHFQFLPFFDAAVKGIGFQIQLCHGLARGDLAALPERNNGIKQAFVNGNGSAAFIAALFLRPFDPVPPSGAGLILIQGAQRTAQGEKRRSCLAARVNFFLQTDKIRTALGDPADRAEQLRTAVGDDREAVDLKTVSLRERFDHPEKRLSVRCMLQAHSKPLLFCRRESIAQSKECVNRFF